MDSQNFEQFVKVNSDFFIVNVIGKSELGKNIYAFTKIYSPSFPYVLISGAIHGREHLSCDLVCAMMKRLKKQKPLSFNLSFVPLVNPDGVDLAINGVAGLDDKTKVSLLSINGSDDFSLYKANAKGVDLNNNFDAGWDKKFSEKTQPSSQGYYGRQPFSESETKALATWTRLIHPALTLSYHLKGEEIYFDYFQEGEKRERDEKIAKVFSQSTGYKIKSTEKVSSGGFKDYCVKRLNIPALTIELGDDNFLHPYPASQLPSIILKNRRIFQDIQKSLEIIDSYKN